MKLRIDVSADDVDDALAAAEKIVTLIRDNNYVVSVSKSEVEGVLRIESGQDVTFSYKVSDE